MADNSRFSPPGRCGSCRVFRFLSLLSFLTIAFSFFYFLRLFQTLDVFPNLFLNLSPSLFRNHSLSSPFPCVSSQESPPTSTEGKSSGIHGDLEREERPWSFAESRTEKLGKGDIAFESLELVDLRFFQGINCQGGECPVFTHCKNKVPKSAARVAACSVRDTVDDPEPSSTLPLNYRGNNQSFDCEAGEKFSGQVFVLENVFINDRGTVFDHKYLYKHATICKSAPLSWGTYRANETTVHVFKEMASVAYYNGPNFYHTMLEVMPSLLLLKTVLARRPGIPVAYRALQEYFFYIFELIDLPPGELNFHMIHDNELFFVERLFLPVMAKCGRPSRALIQKLRKEYFFRPEFPAQNAEKKKNVFEPVVESLSKTENVDSKSESGEAEKSGQLEKLSILPDWRIVIGVREKTRRIAGWEKLKPRLFSLLPKDRISLFDGTLSLLEAKKLFSKTRLYIAPHGAAMTNLVFMPKDGEVLEIRPIQFNNPVYHYVAFICGLKYRLIHGNGTKDSDIDVRHEDILDVIQEIMKNF